MSLLLKLPVDLLRPVLSEWLCFESLPCLDSAMCSSALRPRYLEMLCFVDVSCVCYGPKIVLKWINAKNMKLKALELRGPVSKAWNRALKSQWKNIVTVAVCPWYSKDLSTVNSLKSSILAQLETLSFQGCHDHSMSDLGAIRLHCRKLRSLKYVFRPADEANPLLIEILTLNDQLQSVSLFINATILDYLSTRRPSFASLTAVINDMDTNLFHRILQSCASIKRVQIDWKDCQVSYNKEKTELFWRTNVRIIKSNPTERGKPCLYIPRGEYRDTPLLENVLKQFAELRKFSYSGCQQIDFHVLLQGFPIEEITIIGSNISCEKILATCRYLKRVLACQMILTYKDLKVLIEAFQKYRHSDSGLPLIGEIDFALREGRVGNWYQIEFDGNKFVVHDWTSKASLTDSDNSDIIVDSIKSHEEACKKTKRVEIIQLEAVDN